MTSYNRLTLKFSFKIVIKIVYVFSALDDIAIIGIMKIESYLHDFGVRYDHIRQVLLIVIEHGCYTS